MTFIAIAKYSLSANILSGIVKNVDNYVYSVNKRHIYYVQISN
jgi:hypothetical protein